MNIKSVYDFQTPALIIDNDKMQDNIIFMQKKADRLKVSLRPHTKTHKCPEIAHMQTKAGCKGIACAKASEAEVMAENGLNDIFIANEVVGKDKLERVKILNRSICISIGIDSIFAIKEIEEVFKGEKPLDVLIEIEVGEMRSGITEEFQFIELLKELKTCKYVRLKGIFSHEGHTYQAEDLEDCIKLFVKAQKQTLKFKTIADEFGFHLETVSIGATPSLMLGEDILDGITEIRPGTYILMDASQGSAIGTYDRCAATVLTTIISMPTDERIITDAGAKSLTMQTRNAGICATKGKGMIKNSNGIYIYDMFDEHGIIYSKELRDSLKIGDKIEIIPNHICPVCNLFEYSYLVSHGKLIKKLDILCRGKSQ